MGDATRAMAMLRSLRRAAPPLQLHSVGDSSALLRTLIDQQRWRDARWLTRAPDVQRDESGVWKGCAKALV